MIRFLNFFRKFTSQKKIDIDIHLKYTTLLPSEKGKESEECRVLKNFKYPVTVSA